MGRYPRGVPPPLPTWCTLRTSRFTAFHAVVVFLAVACLGLGSSLYVRHVTSAGESRLLNARADELASLVDSNARVLLACRRLVARAEGVGVDAELRRDLESFLDGVDGVGFWVAERAGDGGRVTSSVGARSELSGQLTTEQWSAVLSGDERPLLPTIRGTRPDGAIVLAFSTPLPAGRAAVLEFNVPELVAGALGRESSLDASLYLGPAAVAPLLMASTDPSGTVTGPSTSRTINLSGVPSTLVVGGRMSTSPEWLATAILAAGLLIGLAAALGVRALQRKRDLLAHHADHDDLTGLANRRRLERTVEQFASAGSVGVLLFDLDGFKAINDLLGHAYGDRSLVIVADRLRGVVPDGVVPARLGGDEFAVCVPTAEQTELGTIARAIQDGVAGAVDLDGHVLQLGLSIGVAGWPGTSDSPAALLRDADMAMYVAKRNGPRSEPVHYTPSLSPSGPALALSVQSPTPGS
ncbi:MAG: GGDEF domain-containing protein [Actinobacteria bacterium]|nr:GGDEF domain-containing protein [Actinomycetota bacterium]